MNSKHEAMVGLDGKVVGYAAGIDIQGDKLVMSLGEAPFVHPGNLNATQLLHYLRKLSSDLEKVVELQSAEFVAKRAAPLAQQRFESAKAELLEAVGPLFQVATLFPESQEEVRFDTYPEGCSSPVPAQLPR